ncbi:hypothetical protein [Psychroserpens sp. Hel_I_66]|uniref:hypothetical protein n=1 Tax=Psychroserpens sp. Hel_I_66 TaxID=1250004 RepID=UPI00068AA889|nr:hypothetical protein [Psychroserpens sp. Hel_I_66]
MVNTGFIMLHREIMEWEWYTDVNTCRLFIHCLLKINYSQKRWQGITVNQGEFITSYEKLAVETGLTVSKVRTAFSKLISTNAVSVETTTTYTKVKIPKFADFIVNSTTNDTHINKPNDKQNSKPITINSQTNNNQLTTTNTNNKLIKNRKKIFRDKVFGHTNFKTKILNSFFNYWSELNVNENRMRFESQEFFEIETRLEKWELNEKKQTPASKVKSTLIKNR